MDSFEFCIDMPIALDGDGPGQTDLAKKLLCDMMRWDTFPAHLDLDTSVEGDDDDIICVGVYVFVKDPS